MRESLKRSLADSPVAGFERYPKGSIVLCNACAKPIFKLDAGFEVGKRAGGAAKLFKPITIGDLIELEGRVDIDAGIRAQIATWTADEKRRHLACLKEPRAGDAMTCPACDGCFVQILTTEVDETNDRAYVIELLTIPPFGVGKPAPVRGRRFDGDRADWLHDTKGRA